MDYNEEDVKEYCFSFLDVLCKHFGVNVQLEFGRSRQSRAWYNDNSIRVGTKDLVSLWDRGGREYATCAWVWQKHNYALRHFGPGYYSGYWVGNPGIEGVQCMLIHEFAHVLNGHRARLGINHADRHGPHFQKCLSDILDFIG